MKHKWHNPHKNKRSDEDTGIRKRMESCNEMTEVNVHEKRMPNCESKFLPVDASQPFELTPATYSCKWREASHQVLTVRRLQRQ